MEEVEDGAEVVVDILEFNMKRIENGIRIMRRMEKVLLNRM